MNKNERQNLVASIEGLRTQVAEGMKQVKENAELARQLMLDIEQAGEEGFEDRGEHALLDDLKDEYDGLLVTLDMLRASLALSGELVQNQTTRILQLTEELHTNYIWED